ncbi:PE-PPE domain-containing protein [Mycobacterium sp. NAZ190054]|uniref:PE-PPE domain-containing protein n=1 Tax=Mycobacterium sp. NAZ190054 TaxID=1747766 RepID=UPI000792FBE2|nr:PE-PPE domain-containing protein [Mycobacterium sp. NAZ190054]KWX67500.1 PE-PPE domain-containing protein [Mycobacterium sp. NAZ190054]
MRGLLATVGAASVAALTLTAPQPYSLAANVLTVTGYTAGGALRWDMSEAFQGSYCDADSGNTCTPVRYLSGLPLVGEADGLRALRSAIGSSAGPTIVMGYSQGALIAADWIERDGDRADSPRPEDLSFVLFGNSVRKYGGVRPAFDIDPPTPEGDYHVTDIALEYDGAADFPDNPFNLLALANAFAGFQYVHIYGYDDADLEDGDKLVWVDGNTTYVLIRQQNIPLLEPLRRLGLHDLADRLNGPLKEIIDSAYDRDYPGLLDPENSAPQSVSNGAEEEVADDLTVDATVDAAPSLRLGSGTGTATLGFTDEDEKDSTPVDLADDVDHDAEQPLDEAPVDDSSDDVADETAEDETAEDEETGDEETGDAESGSDEPESDSDDATSGASGGGSEPDSDSDSAGSAE